MRITIEIDDNLMAAAMKASRAETKREAVELGLRSLILLKRQQEVRRLRCQVQWHSDLDAMRRDR